MSSEVHRESTADEYIQAAARVLLQSVVKLIEADPHQWSKRPCGTCAAVSTIIGRPFGCQAKAIIERGPS